MEYVKLAAALVAAQSKARAVGLDGKNQHQGYRYATAEAIIDECRAALASAGLALLASGWGLRLEANDVPCIVVDYLLVHESGESMAMTTCMPAIEGKGRPIDKAACAALTTGLAYTLRALLLLPRDDDAAAIDARDDRGYEPTPPPPQAAPTDDDPQAQEAKDFEALILEFGRTGNLAELEGLPAKIMAANFPKPIYQRLVEVFNPIATKLRAERKAANEEAA